MNMSERHGSGYAGANVVNPDIFWVTGLLLLSFDAIVLLIQGGSNMTGTNCDLFTHK
jgi:hypothetical protein